MLNLNLLENHSTVAIFGSSARKDSDKLSDIDLLIISDQKKNSKIFDEIKSSGYSPSIYSWSGLERLSRNGSLFLIHLKNEALILKDEDSKLKNLLFKTQPIGNYKRSQIESIQLAEVTRGLPDSPLLKLWAADVLAVAFRNYMISYAAQNNEFIFSYRCLIDYAQNKLNLDPITVECLHKLREWKACYRNKATYQDIPLPKLSEILIVQGFFKMNINNSSHCVCETNDAFLNRLLSTSNSRNWYQNLRIYEGAFRAINEYSMSVKKASEIEELISSPTYYANDGKVSWKKLKSFVLTHFQHH